ncbi:hypothetical protein BDW42DRAFT_172957 [Aspergillus taichungensis]|uniref:Uncharacterized protein n=1 Tax=Aspergillus taichungensis TaxID=482145 RepID=A0A2J5HQ36_9EURO|nr:hypothetical protein BDW42DRAFT_172957 [Aspergillus taichungensis]
MILRLLSLYSPLCRVSNGIIAVFIVVVLRHHQRRASTPSWKSWYARNRQGSRRSPYYAFPPPYPFPALRPPDSILNEELGQRHHHCFLFSVVNRTKGRWH